MPYHGHIYVVVLERWKMSKAADPSLASVCHERPIIVSGKSYLLQKAVLTCLILPTPDALKSNRSDATVR